MLSAGRLTPAESGRHYVVIVAQYGELFEIVLKFCNMRRNLFFYLFIELLLGNKDGILQIHILKHKPLVFPVAFRQTVNGQAPILDYKEIFLPFGSSHRKLLCHHCQILAVCSEVLPSWLATLCFLVWYSFSGKHIALAFGDIVFVQRYSLESLVCGQQNVQHFWLIL